MNVRRFRRSIAAIGVALATTPVAAYDSACWDYNRGMTPSDEAHDLRRSAVSVLESLPQSSAQDCHESYGPGAARQRWIGEGDEHRQIFRRALALAGVPQSVDETNRLDVFVAASTVGSYASVSAVDFTQTTRIERRYFSPGEFAQLPDFSYALWDWSSGNEQCPPATLATDPTACHGFTSHMGATNASHFLPLAGDFYHYYHVLALARATECSSLVGTLRSRGQFDRFRPFAEACETEALAIEAIAQHYLQDAWSTGHMWHRWGSPSLVDFPGVDANTRLWIGRAVAGAAGLIHGAKGFLDGRLGNRVRFDDSLCAPSMEVLFAAPGLASPQRGLGDLFLDRLGTDETFSFQYRRMFSCAARSVRQVYERAGAVHGAVSPPDSLVDPSVEPDSDACFGQRATNAAMVAGMGLDVVADARIELPLVGTVGAEHHYRISLDQLLGAGGLVLIGGPAGVTATESLLSQYGSRLQEGLAAVAVIAESEAHDLPGAMNGTSLATGGLGSLLGVPPSGQSLPLGAAGYRRNRAWPVEYVDPPLPWPTTSLASVPAAEYEATRARAALLARTFHRAHVADWCQAIDGPQLLSLRRRVSTVTSERRDAALAVCKEFVVRHLRAGSGPTSYDAAREPVCAVLVPVSAVVYEADVTGATSLEALAERWCLRPPCGPPRTECGTACADLSNDPLHCGRCDRACEFPPGAAPTCVAGECGFSCATDTHACAGACVSNRAVGSCGAACSPCPDRPHAAASCDGVRCSFTCDLGWADCDADPSNGCESDLTESSHCGSCIVMCGGAAPVCEFAGAAARCASGCSAASPIRCGMSCVDTRSDPSNCGRCDGACPAVANGRPTCVAGACSYACDAGFHACGGACVSNTSVTTCGVSCSPCSAPTNATPTCDGTVCGFTCTAGYHNCDGACVRDTAVATCGTSCGPVCAAPPNAVATCNGVACGFTCNVGYVASGAGCALIPPRPIAPLSTSTVTSRRPNLRWELAAGTEGVHVEICRTRACTSLITQFDVTGTGGAPSTDLPRGVVFWRLSGRSGGSTVTTPSATWQFTVGARTAPLNTSWGTTLDVNGDGYADLGVGAPGANSYSGAAYVYLGSGSGLSTSPATTLNGPPVGAADPHPFFGRSVSSAGDVNGDGYADFLVGADGANSAVGAVYLYLGSASGLSTTPATTLNGPGGNSGFGFSVASAGDVNGDGYADVVTGLFTSNSAAGGIFIYLGSALGLSTAPATAIDGTSVRAYYFGFPVASAGDVNGDGYADVVVGAELTGAGAAYVYLGSASGLRTSAATTFAARSGDAYFGQSVAGAGDVNGDGYADVVVGTNSSAGGGACIYLGSASGVSPSIATTLLGPNPGSNPGSSFGESVASAGDVNGDGYADIVVGAENASADVGAAFVYLGGASGLASSAVAELNGSGRYAYFGQPVAGAGDVDGDGYGDVAVGAMSAYSSGFVYLFLGRAAGLSTSSATTLSRPIADGGFGTSLARARGLSSTGNRVVALVDRSGATGRAYVSNASRYPETMRDVVVIQPSQCESEDGVGRPVGEFQMICGAAHHAFHPHRHTIRPVGS